MEKTKKIEMKNEIARNVQMGSEFWRPKNFRSGIFRENTATDIHARGTQFEPAKKSIARIQRPCPEPVGL